MLILNATQHVSRLARRSFRLESTLLSIRCECFLYETLCDERRDNVTFLYAHCLFFDSVLYLGPEYSRFTPKFFYWVFIPCDIVSLALQGAGGGLSSSSSGSSQVGVDIAIAGLSFQVATLAIFIALSLDYAVRRYKENRRTSTLEGRLPAKFKLFITFLSIAIVLILIRCVYRIDELSDGYMGPLIHNEGLFIGLEGV